jgi:uncharacterized phage protein gp47/JayE
MQLSLQTFQQLVQRMSASVQSSASQLVDLSVGSLLRAILEANASIGLWIQWLIVQVLGMTRAATSKGADLDSWMADFGLIRLPAVSAQGIVTFSRLLTNQDLSIPAGTQVKCSTNGNVYSVMADSANSSWQPTSNSYIIPIGVSSIDLPIVAQSPGTAGNVIAGAIATIASSVPGLDFASNSSPIVGGIDAESDDNFRVRFRAYINSRSQATIDAVTYAVTSLQQSMRVAQFENTDANGAWLPGHFLVIVDDGTGQPSASVLANAYGAIDRVRPIGTSFSVQPPVAVPVSVNISMTSGTNPLPSAVQTDIITAVTSYIQQLSIGSTLSITRLIEVAYRAGPLTQNIGSITVNGATADFVTTPYSVLTVQAVTVE